MYTKILCASAIVIYSSAAMADEKWAPTFELEGRTNSDRSLVSPKFLIPLAQDENSMIFTDLRTRLDDNSSEEYNIGLGYRAINNGWIYGGYTFADYLSSANGKAYWQGTAGLEMLNEDWDLRLNGYLPESTKHQINAGAAGGLAVDGGGNFIINSAGGSSFERALPGVDAEVGYKLPIEGIDLRVFGGAYYFDASDFDSVSGPKARAELTFNEDNTEFLSNGIEFTLGVQYQNDGPRENTTTALAQLRIPFWANEKSSKLSPLEKRMTNFIERDIDIVAGESAASAPTKLEDATLTINGQSYTGIDATLNSSTADAQDAVDNAGTYALILIDGAPVYSGNLNLLSGQTLIGGGASITVTGNTSSNTFSGNLPGTTAALPFNVHAVSQNDVTLKNLEVAGGGDNIFIQGNNILIEDVTSHSGGVGIYVYNSNGVTIDNVTVQDTGAGILTNGSSNITISDTNIENTVNEGLILYNSNLINISGTTISSNTGYIVSLYDATNATGTVDGSGSATGCQLTGTNTGSNIIINGFGTCP